MTRPMPQWAVDNGYSSARELDDGLWLVICPMIGDIELAVVTPPPDGGKLEFWDYDGDTMGALDCIQAFWLFPDRDNRTEMWNRHFDGKTDRRHRRIEDTL